MLALLPKPVTSAVPIPPMQLEVLLSALDMRPGVERVDDQKRQGSCVAQSEQKAVEICYKRAGQPVNLSAQYAYYPLQLLSGTLGLPGGGAFVSQVGKAMNEWGICREETWPYDAAKEGVEPSAEAQAEGRAMFPPGSTQFQYVPGLHAIKRSLNLGMPVLMTIYAHPDLFTLGNNWRTHTIDTSATPTGQHEIVVIGYDDSVSRLLIEGSWGPGYADGGFFGICYEYLQPGRLVLDSYAFTKLPVPLVPEVGYIPEDMAWFYTETGILTLPSLKLYTPDFGYTRFKRVVVRIVKFGKVLADDPAFVYDETNYFILDTFMRHEQMLGLPKVTVDGFEYPRVTLVGAEYEVLAGEPA